MLGSHMNPFYFKIFIFSETFFQDDCTYQNWTALNFVFTNLNVLNH